MIGKRIRLDRILADSGPTLVLTLDSLVIYSSGPSPLRVDTICEAWAHCGANAVMGFQGTLDRLRVDKRLARIAAVSLSTESGDPITKVLGYSAEHCVRHGVDGIAVQMHVGAVHENEMLMDVTRVLEQADRYGMPVMVIAYPRPEPSVQDIEVDAHIHAARIAVELGADMVKVQMLEDRGAMKAVVEACAGVPVLAAGGEMSDLPSFLTKVETTFDAGVKGVCVGRNITARDDWLGAVTELANLAR